MTRSRYIVVLVFALLLVPMLAASAATRQDQPVRIDRLNVGSFGGGANPQSNFNPFSFNALAGTSDWLFEPLMVVNAYSCEIVPWLATAYEWPDPLTLNLTIRDGVTWSDGTPLTAEDVVFTFKMLQRFDAIDFDGLWHVLADVTSSGNVVTFTFTEQAGSLFSKIIDKRIVPRHLWVDVEDPVTFTNDQPVGTGPFTLKSFNRAELVYGRNPSYWLAERILVEELYYGVSEGDATVNQLRLAEGRYDWEGMFFPDIEDSYVAKDPEHNHYWFPAGGSVSLMMNHTMEPLNDPEFRRGIAYAFDRQGMADRAAFGYTGAASQTFLTLPNQEVYLDPSIPNQGYIPYDPAQADQILTAAGYTRDGDGPRLGKDGEPISLVFSVEAGWNDWVQAAEILRDNLDAIGIEVEVQSITPDIVLDDRKAGNFELTFDAPGGGCDMYGGFFYPLADSDAPVAMGTVTENNWSRWNDPETAQLLDQLRAAPDVEAQKPILYQLEQIMVNELPFIPLWHGPVWFQYRTEKAVGWPSAENPYAHPGNKLLIITNLTPAPDYQPGA